MDAVAAVAGVLALLVGLGAGALLLRGSSKTEFAAYHPLTFRRGIVHSARFAPDGKTVIYSAAWEGKPLDLYTTRPESPQSQLLEPKGADVLAVSASGEMLLALHSKPRDSAFLICGHVGPGAAGGGSATRDSERRGVGGLVARRNQRGCRSTKWEDGNGWSFRWARYSTRRMGGLEIRASGPTERPLHSWIIRRLGTTAGQSPIIDLAGKKTILSDGWDSLQGLGVVSG